MENIGITKVCVLKDKRLAIFPDKFSNSFQYVYREAAEVYWDNDLNCFVSPVPREWNYTNWYKHIISTVLSGLNIKLNLKEDTEISGNIPEFKTEILNANKEIQKWIKDNYSDT